MTRICVKVLSFVHGTFPMNEASLGVSLLVHLLFLLFLLPQNVSCFVLIYCASYTIWGGGGI